MNFLNKLIKYTRDELKMYYHPDCEKELITDRKLTYKERWFLAYGITFDEWLDNNEKNGDFIIPSCALECFWDEDNIPKFESGIENYNKLKKYEKSINNFLKK